jgi:hypothetical protein
MLKKLTNLLDSYRFRLYTTGAMLASMLAATAWALYRDDTVSAFAALIFALFLLERFETIIWREKSLRYHDVHMDYLHTTLMLARLEAAPGSGTKEDPIRFGEHDVDVKAPDDETEPEYGTPAVNVDTNVKEATRARRASAHLRT